MAVGTEIPLLVRVGFDLLVRTGVPLLVRVEPFTTIIDVCPNAKVTGSKLHAAVTGSNLGVNVTGNCK